MGEDNGDDVECRGEMTTTKMWNGDDNDDGDDDGVLITTAKIYEERRQIVNSDDFTYKRTRYTRYTRWDIDHISHMILHMIHTPSSCNAISDSCVFSFIVANGLFIGQKQN